MARGLEAGTPIGTEREVTVGRKSAQREKRFIKNASAAMRWPAALQLLFGETEVISAEAVTKICVCGPTPTFAFHLGARLRMLESKDH